MNVHPLFPKILLNIPNDKVVRPLFPNVNVRHLLVPLHIFYNHQKKDDSNKNKYLEAGSAPLKLFKNNSVVASFYEVPVEIIEDADQFVVWAQESLNIQKRKK